MPGTFQLPLLIHPSIFPLLPVTGWWYTWDTWMYFHPLWLLAGSVNQKPKKVIGWREDSEIRIFIPFIPSYQNSIQLGLGSWIKCFSQACQHDMTSLSRFWLAPHPFKPGGTNSQPHIKPCTTAPNMQFHKTYTSVNSPFGSKPSLKYSNLSVPSNSFWDLAWYKWRGMERKLGKIRHINELKKIVCKGKIIFSFVCL